jgi:FAD/FMN-containing dehydrogenase
MNGNYGTVTPGLVQELEERVGKGRVIADSERQIGLMKAIKAAFDPAGILNPGKVL